MSTITFLTFFSIVVIVMILIETRLFKTAHAPSFRQAISESLFWVLLSLLFCGGIFIFQGKESGLNFLSAYLLEKSLSIDNLFVFLLLFSQLKIDPAHQRSVLLYGIIGAIVFRALFIFLGITLLSHFHWAIYLFAVFLVYNALQMLRKRPKKEKLRHGGWLKFLKKWLPISEKSPRGQFFFKSNGKVWVSPLLFALFAIELTDIAFAIDSIPAVLAITSDPFIVYTSNIFALLGLRAIYFLLLPLIKRFRYLHQGLALILFYIALKMFLSGVVTIPSYWTLLFILVVLSSTVLLSLKRR